MSEISTKHSKFKKQYLLGFDLDMIISEKYNLPSSIHLTFFFVDFTKEV